MENKESIQLSLDGAEFEGSSNAVQLISDSIKKRDAQIELLKNQLKENSMSTKEYKIGDKYHRFDSLDAMFNELNPLYNDMKAKCDEFMSKYNNAKAKCDEFMAKYNDVATKYSDMKAQCDELMGKYNDMCMTSTKKDSEVETLKGENLILKNELDKRSDADLINAQVTERCNLITDVSTRLKLDSQELFPLSNKDIKIKAIKATCELPVHTDMDDSFIDGAFAIAMKLPRSDFNEEVKKIENIKTQTNQDVNPDLVDLQRRIQLLNGGN